MKVSSFGHKFDQLEQFIHHHADPSSANHFRFQTSNGKSLSNTKIIKDFEALAKTMERVHQPLDLDEKKAIYGVLSTIKYLASDKIHHRYVVFSEQNHPVLQKRIEQIDSLLFRLGVTRQKPENQSDTTKQILQGSHLQMSIAKSLPRAELRQSTHKQLLEE